MFHDRFQAGRYLAGQLSEINLEEPVVLALPRGGVPVGFEIARQLKAPLDLLMVKKIRSPKQPELALGAISEDGAPVWQKDIVGRMNLGPAELEDLVNEARETLAAQVKRWAPMRVSAAITDRSVIVVDDGLATGATMAAALQILRRKKPKRLIAAAPIASSSAAEVVKPWADDIVFLKQPEPFYCVGQWYEDFTQVPDTEVDRLLRLSQSAETEMTSGFDSPISISYKGLKLPGHLTIPNALQAPEGTRGLVIFAHGSGSTHRSPRNIKVATELQDQGFGTLLFDLLTPEEASDRSNVFNVPLLAKRLKIGTDWARTHKESKNLAISYFGASTGAAAALLAAAKDHKITSIVSRGGRPDLAIDSLPQVRCPVLLIVGGRDYGVIEFNEKAKASLESCTLAIVPEATHLFEEPGTLEKVTELAADWFSRTHSCDGAMPGLATEEPIQNRISQIACPITGEKDLTGLIRDISHSKIVMLGEATHGTEEFYELRRLISQKLIENHDFKFIAVEGDWPDCYRLNRYIHSNKGQSARHIMKSFARWPTWMWANEQTAEMIEWLRHRKASFFGLDVYSLFDSMDIVKKYSDRMGEDFGRRIREAYACFNSFNRSEIAYARSLIQFPPGCQKEVVRNLREILRLRFEDTELALEEFFDVKQNAKIINSAERYYRAMLKGDQESWNIRDQHMLDTLDTLIQRYGKAIVWAHNTHVGDYHATDMLDDGYLNLGGLARERYGSSEVALVGFGTFSGEVLAGRAWGAKPEAMPLPEALKESYEAHLHAVAQKKLMPKFYMKTKGETLLNLKRAHRAVGVVYQPDLEGRHSRNYVPTELSKRYDHFIFIDKTTALKALPADGAKGKIPETWPMGA